jgi:hypothetical protein
LLEALHLAAVEALGTVAIPRDELRYW